MGLSTDLIKEFVRITNDTTKPTDTEKIVYATVKKDGEETRVQLDGSDQLTPVATTIDVADGDRVTVLIKNHTATITGNISSPAARQVVVQGYGDQIDAAVANIGDLTANNAVINGKLEANEAEIKTLKADIADLDFASIDELEAINAKIYNLETTYATVEQLNAVNARIDNLDVGDLTADFVKTKDLETEVAKLGYATVTQLNATNAEITSLNATKLNASELSAEVAKLGYATVGQLTATNAEITSLKTSKLDVSKLSAEVAKLGYATVDQLNATNANISSLDSKYANIELSNVSVQNVGKLFADVGLITSATIQNGKVTGYLDSVSVHADSITAGQLTVDRLVVRGTDKSIVYELNNITGALQAVQSDTLNGEILTDRSITVDKIVAKSITANEIAAGAITATEIASNAITAAKIKAGEVTAEKIDMASLTAHSAFINAISTNSIVVGASNVAASAQAIANTANGKANDALTSINKISSIKYVETTYSTTFAQLKGWSEEGKSGSWSVPSTADMRVGDTLYLRCTNTTTSRYIYIAVTVTNINHETSITATSHGFIDPAATDAAASAQSTANTASSNASTALSTANTASTNANTALSTANTASSNASSALSKANAVNSVIAEWCWNNNTTYIDGGNIYTETIKADSIDVNDLFAKEITATKLHITGESTFQGSITGSTITGGWITSVAEDGRTVMIGDGFIYADDGDQNLLMSYGGNEIKFYSIHSPGVLSGVITSLYYEADELNSISIAAHNGLNLILPSEFPVFYVGNYGDSSMDDGVWFIISAEDYLTSINMNAYISGELSVKNLEIRTTASDETALRVFGNTRLAGVTATGLTVSGDIYAQYMEPSELYVCGNGHLEGKLEAEGEIISTNATAFRSVYGNYGAFVYNNGDNVMLMLTNSGDQYGTYNSLRPMYVNLSNGSVTFGTPVCLLNGNTLSTKNASGTWCTSLTMNTSNHMIFGSGTATEVHLGDKANTGRLRIFSKGRIDLCAYGQTSDGNSVSLAGSASAPEFRPTANGTVNLGSSSYKWKYVYATNGTIQTSDRRYKSDITNLDERYEAMAQLLVAKSFIMDLIDEKRRVGYIAQDLEEIALSVGLTMDECSFINKDWIERKDYTGYEYSLDYTQIHTMCIASLQKQVRELQNRVAIAEAQLEHYQTQQLGS